MFHDYDSYSLKLTDNNIVQVYARFEKSDNVSWEINYDEFFK